MIATSIILVAAARHDLALGKGFGFRSRGRLRLKGLDEGRCGRDGQHHSQDARSSHFRHRFGTRDPSALSSLGNESARGSRCPSLMVWLAMPHIHGWTSVARERRR